MQRTSEEIQAAMKQARIVRKTPGTVTPILADYILELHDRLREGNEELTYALPTDDSPIEIQERIDTTLAKLPEEYQ